MRISLRAGEKLYLNGAVVSVDRKVSLELLNDATFLLEAHVLQECDAHSPLRQIYFVVQSMLMNPSGTQAAGEIVEQMFRGVLSASTGHEIAGDVADARESFRAGRLIETLKSLRALFATEVVAESRMLA